MSVNWVFFIICSVCLSAVVLGDIIRDLKKQIEDTKKETNLVNEENKKLEEALTAETEAWYEWVNITTGVLTNLDKEHTALITEMKLLNKMIIGNQTEKIVLLGAIEIANMTASKFDLGITIMNDVLDLLENGRKKDYNNQCEYYERVFKSLLFNEAINIDPNNTIKILKAELREAKLELQKVTFRKQELVNSLAQTTQNFKDSKTHYGKQIHDAIENLKKAESTVNDFKNELGVLLKEMDELKNTLEAITKSIVKKQADAEKLESRYEVYDKDIACYKRLQKDVFERS